MFLYINVKNIINIKIIKESITYQAFFLQKVLLIF